MKARNLIRFEVFGISVKHVHVNNDVEFYVLFISIYST